MATLGLAALLAPVPASGQSILVSPTVTAEINVVFEDPQFGHTKEIGYRYTGHSFPLGSIENASFDYGGTTHTINWLYTTDTAYMDEGVLVTSIQFNIVFSPDLPDALAGAVLSSGSIELVLSEADDVYTWPDHGTNYQWNVTAATNPFNGVSDDDTVNFQLFLPGAATNIAPVFADSSLTRTVEENTAADTNIGDPVTATDTNGDTLTYSLEGTDANDFTIVPASGQIKTKTGVSYNHETKASYAITVKADDGNGGTDTVAVTVNVTDVDEPPAAPAAPTVSAVSGNPTSLAVSWSAPANTGPAITSYDLQYRQGTSGDFTDGPQDVASNRATITLTLHDTEYQVQVRATNDEGDSDWSLPGTGSTGSSNNDPTFTEGASATRSIAENTAAGTDIGNRVGAADADTSDTLGYTLGGTDAASFAIVSTSGQLQTKAGVTYNFEAKSSYSVTVTVSDGNGGSDSIDVTISVTDENEQPSRPAAPNVVATSGSTTSLTVSWTAPGLNGGPALTGYNLQYRPGTSGNFTAGPQNLTGTSTTIASLLADTSYQVQVQALNGETPSDWSLPGTGSTESESITPPPSNNDPTFTEGASATRSIAENTAAGTDIGNRVGAADADTSDTLGYTLGGTDAASFAIVSTSGQLQTKAGVTYNFEAKSSYSVTVTVSDGNGGSDSIDVTISVTDENEQPSRPAAPNVVATSGSTTSLTVSWTAPGLNGGPALTGYNLQYRPGTSGNFTAGPQNLTGTSTTIASLLADTSYQVQVQALNGETPSDWSLPGTGSTDVPPTPLSTDATLSSLVLYEYPPTDPPTVLVTLDPPFVSSTINYRAASVPANESIVTVAVTPNSLDATVVIVPDSLPSTTTESHVGLSVGENTITVTVTAEDTVTIKTYTVTMERLPYAPEFLGTRRVLYVAENTAADTNIGDPVTARDNDGDTLTYTLEGTDANAFTIDSSTGQIKTRTGVSYNYENKKLYEFTVKADDGNGGTDTVAVEMHLTNVDEQPATPAAPLVAGSYTRLGVSWTLPYLNGGPYIRGYAVQYRPGTSGNWLDHSHSGPGRSTTITRLLASTEYQVRVRAQNGETDSEWSEPGSGATAGEGVTLSTASLVVSEGGSETYTAVLASQPTGPVTVTPAVSGDRDVTVSPASLTFSGMTWNRPQTVTVSAAHDPGNLDDTAVVSHQVTGADYAGVTADDVRITVTDDDLSYGTIDAHFRAVRGGADEVAGWDGPLPDIHFGEAFQLSVHFRRAGNRVNLDNDAEYPYQGGPKATRGAQWLGPDRALRVTGATVRFLETANWRVRMELAPTGRDDVTVTVQPLPCPAAGAMCNGSNGLANRLHLSVRGVSGPPEAPGNVTVEQIDYNGNQQPDLRVSFDLDPVGIDYRIQWQRAGQAWASPEEETGWRGQRRSGQESDVIFDVSTGQAYDVRVRWENPNGAGAWTTLYNVPMSGQMPNPIQGPPLTVGMTSGTEPPVEGPFTVRFSFSEPVTGFTGSDIETGQAPACTDEQNIAVSCDPDIGALETVDDRVFSATVTPTTEQVVHNYTLSLTVPAGRVTSVVGNKPNEEGMLEVRVAPPGVTEPISSVGLMASGGNEEVSLSWNLPSNYGGSPIIRYEYRFAAAGAEWSPWENVGVGENGITVGNLVNGREYVFETRAVNALGKGPVETVMATPLPPPPPSPPSPPSPLPPPPGENNSPPAEDRIYYFPHLAVGAGWQTTITYINYSPQEVTCRTDFLSDDGTPLLVSFTELGTVVNRTDVLPPGGSVHQETNVVLSAPLAPGWARSSCSGPLKASLLFRRHNHEGVPTGEAGLNATAVPATRFVTFAEQGEGKAGTGVAYANPSDTEAMITFTVRDAAGQTLASVEQTLSAGGHGAQNMAGLFDLPSFTGSIEVTSTVPIVSLSLNFEADPVFSSLPPGELDAAAQGPQEMTTYYFPHLAVGASWQTTLTYINYSPQEVSCRTEFISDHGAPLLVSFPGRGMDISRTDVLQPGGSVHQETNVDLGAPLAPGWARASCSGPVKASLLFRRYDSAGVTVAEAVVNATTVPATRFVSFAEQGEGRFGTGVAYANPSATAALVTFTVRDAAGEMLASVEHSLLPAGHDAQNMAGLFDLPSFTGSLEITSTEPIVTLSLNFEADPVFSSLPPGEVDAAAQGSTSSSQASIRATSTTPYR